MDGAISIILDSFKGSIGAVELGAALQGRLRPHFPDREIVNFPCSDGGDGFAEAVGYHFQGHRVECTVSDPLMRPRTAHYIWSPTDKLAIIESAQANGLALLKKEELNPLKTTTWGVGELLLDAKERGAERIIIGVGGSATVDGGLGMAQALGWRFTTLTGREIGPLMGEFKMPAVITAPEPHPLAGVRIEVACDVTTETTRAVSIYGPQKGATPAMVDELKHDFEQLDSSMRLHAKRQFAGIEMGGAAGALAAGLTAFADAELKLGMMLFDDVAGLQQQIERSSLVITGEGKLDEQTRFGKVVSYVAQRCRSAGVPVIALCGMAEASDLDLDDVVALTESGMPPDDCIARPLDALDRVLPDLLELVTRYGR